MNATDVNLQINGEPCTCHAELTLPILLESRGFNLRLIAVEYNGEILHRQFWSETTIQNGDKIEVVTIVGGG